MKRVTTGQKIMALVVFVAAVGGLTLVLEQDKSPEATIGQNACTSEFGADWSYSGYLIGTPPTVQCSGPNGEIGVMEMPIEMQQELNIVVANASENE